MRQHRPSRYDLKAFEVAPQEASQAQCETTGGGGQLAGSANGENGRGRAAARRANVPRLALVGPLQP